MENDLEPDEPLPPRRNLFEVERRKQPDPEEWESIWEGEAKNLEESVREAVAADPDLRPGVYRTLNTRVSRARFVYFTVWINHGEIVRLEHHGVDRP
jgi:hypothetical protein